MDWRRKYVQSIILFGNEICSLNRNTIHLAIFIVDLFIDGNAHQVNWSQLDLVVASAIRLAAKVNEHRNFVPNTSDLEMST